MHAIERILQRIQGAKKHGKGWRAPCPAHGGKGHNLAIYEHDNGKVGLTCHSHGCKPDDVIAALGLTWREIHGHGNGVIYSRSKPRLTLQQRNYSLELYKLACAHGAASERDSSRAVLIGDGIESWQLDSLERAVAHHVSAGTTDRIIGLELPTWRPDDDAAPELAPADAGKVVASCYKYRALVAPDGLELAAQQAGESVETVEHIWREHLSKKAMPMHRIERPSRTFGTFRAALAYAGTDRNIALLAALGSGKNQRFVKQLKASNGGKFWSITTLTALVDSNAASAQTAHYRDDLSVISATGSVTSTVHWLTSEAGKLQAAGMGAGDTVVIDEFDAVARMLLDVPTILDRFKQAETLEALTAMREAGVRFILLDGDYSAAGRELAALLGCESVEVTEQEYAQPRAVIRQQVEEGGLLSRTFDADIKRLLSAGERVVIMADSCRAANADAVQFGRITQSILVITSENRDEPAQAEFLRNPNGMASKYDLIIASPTLNFGFSVTSVSAHVFVKCTSGVLGAQQIWQFARRWRAPAGGVIRFSMARHLCRPRRAVETLEQISRDYAKLGDVSAWTRGRIACEYIDAINDSNPVHALMGFLQCAGIGVSVEFDDAGDFETVISAKEIREQVEAERIERIRTAESVPLAALSKRATVTDTAQLRRARIEDNLLLTVEDYEPDGTLPRELVERCEYDALESRAMRLAWLAVKRQGVMLADGKRREFVDAQVEIVRDMLAEIPAGGFTAGDVERIAAEHGSRIRLAYKSLSKPPKPKRGQSDAEKKRAMMRWFISLLESWGIESHSRRREENGGKRVRIFTIAECPDASKYAEKIACQILLENSRKPMI
ncbi:MAG: hypothetical protein ACMV0I_06380 [Pseudomonas sp.]